MKKFISKILPACVIVVVVFLILLVLLSRSEDIPSYRFLGGRSPIAYKDVKTQGIDKCYYYSFEGDFNDICLKADAELIGSGFVVNTNIGKTLSGNEYSIRNYMQKNRFPRGPVWIVIQNNREYIENPDSENRALHPKDGWVVVMITYWRGWQWAF